MLMSIFLFPYLIKVLGNNNYGVYAFTQAILGYSLLFVNYGFSITGAREIALTKQNYKDRRLVFSSIITVKFLIFLMVAGLIIIASFFIPILFEYQKSYLIIILALLGWVLFPDWYFQGIEKMQFITYLMLFFKFLALVLVFFFIKNNSDLFLAVFINSVSILLIGVFGFIAVIYNEKHFFFEIPNSYNIKKYFKEGRAFFLSNVAANTKDYCNTFIVGAFFSYAEVGLYDLIVKIIRIALMPQSIFIRAIFPKVSISRSKKIIKNSQKISVVYGIFVFLIVLLIGEFILNYLSEESIKLENISTLYIMSLSIPLLCVSGIKGSLVLLGFKKDKLFAKGIFKSIIVYFTGLIILVLLNKINLISITLLLIASTVSELVSHHFFSKRVLSNE